MDHYLNITMSVSVNLSMENRVIQKKIVDYGGISKILSKISVDLNDESIDFITTGFKLMANILEIGLFY